MGWYIWQSNKKRLKLKYLNQKSRVMHGSFFVVNVVIRERDFCTCSDIYLKRENGEGFLYLFHLTISKVFSHISYTINNKEVWL